MEEAEKCEQPGLTVRGRSGGEEAAGALRSFGALRLFAGGYADPYTAGGGTEFEGPPLVLLYREIGPAKAPLQRRGCGAA